jgi:putative endonuclease
MKSLGDRGEDTALEYYVQRGYRIIARNYRWKRGEIDVIAEKGDTLVCAEVKAWRQVPYAELGYALDARKRSTIVQGSRRFLREHPRYGSYFIRYDVIFVDPERGTLRHIRDAFQDTGAA